jgi:hypothetical protein
VYWSGLVLHRDDVSMSLRAPCHAVCVSRALRMCAAHPSGECCLQVVLTVCAQCATFSTLKTVP